MANIPVMDVESPNELETPGIIRIRGRILGNARLGKKAGIAAIAVLILLLSAILYGVTLSGSHVGALYQKLPRPLPAENDTPWWQNQSNASGVIQSHSGNTPVESRSLPAGVPDLNQVGATSNPTPKAPGIPAQENVSKEPVQITKFPTLPPIDANSAASNHRTACSRARQGRSTEGVGTADTSATWVGTSDAPVAWVGTSDEGGSEKGKTT